MVDVVLPAGAPVTPAAAREVLPRVARPHGGEPGEALEMDLILSTTEVSHLSRPPT